MEVLTALERRFDAGAASDSTSKCGIHVVGCQFHHPGLVEQLRQRVGAK